MLGMLYIKLCIGNHCHKYSTDCKYNITLWFYNIFKAGKFKGLKSHIMKKNQPIKQKNVFTDNTLQTSNLLEKKDMNSTR